MVVLDFDGGLCGLLHRLVELRDGGDRRFADDGFDLGALFGRAFIAAARKVAESLDLFHGFRYTCGRETREFLCLGFVGGDGGTGLAGGCGFGHWRSPFVGTIAVKI